MFLHIIDNLLTPFSFSAIVFMLTTTLPGGAPDRSANHPVAGVPFLPSNFRLSP
jgi:hypothetical protein